MNNRNEKGQFVKKEEPIDVEAVEIPNENDDHDELCLLQPSEPAKARREAREAAAPDLGDDPDGDIESYIGPDLQRAVELVDEAERMLTPMLVGQMVTEVMAFFGVLPVDDIEQVDLDQLDYEEDCDILRILCGKVFRKAIVAGAELPPMPDIEAQAVEASGALLDEVFNDLDDARDGKTELDWQLAEWKKELAA